MTAPENCPHCGSKRCPDSDDFECDLWYYDGNSSQRAAECYEIEIAKLKARCERLDRMIRKMLLSADCSWEEHNEGHDWRDICEEARALLNEVTP